jgi:predicted HicB family RNase H-like nuclease
MGDKYTEAQKKASMKYLKDKTDSIQIRVTKGTKERWKAAAEIRGKSLNQMIVDTMEAEIQKTE